MITENSESVNENTLLEDKIEIHKNFIEKLRLDVDIDGGSVAGLIEDIVEQHPNKWREEIEKILQKTLQLEQQESLQSAMFYLGDLIHALDIKSIQASSYPEPGEKEATLELRNTTSAWRRRDWDASDRIIGSILQEDRQPEWWVNIDMQSGKHDEFIKRLQSGDVQKNIDSVLNDIEKKK
jgi:hypothetical protein